VEAHGSKVFVKSAVDEGSEFSFQLKKWFFSPIFTIPDLI
jgi:hypothetical protein